VRKISRKNEGALRQWHGFIRDLLDERDALEQASNLVACTIMYACAGRGELRRIAHEEKLVAQSLLAH